MPPLRLVVLGPPGAGCRSVGQALSQVMAVPFDGLGEIVAKELGVRPQTALVEASESHYRRVEADCALRLLKGLASRTEGGVLALGSGCLEQDQVLEALEDVELAGGHVVALVATPRCLATRNGLDAPRSLALGSVYHQFTQMLRAREERCQMLADLVVDTTRTTVQEACGHVLDAVAG